jgi:hypothetical protein
VTYDIAASALRRRARLQIATLIGWLSYLAHEVELLHFLRGEGAVLDAYVVDGIGRY